MNAAEFLASLWRRDAFVVAEGGRLAIDAPAGVLTDADRARLAELELAILATLGVAPPRCPACRTEQPPGWDWTRRPCAVCHPPAGQPSDAARRQAARSFAAGPAPIGRDAGDGGQPPRRVAGGATQGDA